MLDPIEHRRRQIENINKAFSGNNEIEKAWKIGDEKQYQGATWVVGGFNAKGTPLWRKKKDGGSGTAPAQTPASKSGSSKVSIDETSIDQSEYDRMHAQAQSVDKNSRSLGLKIIEGNIKQVKSELEDTIKNRPGAKAKIADLQKKLTMFVSQKKATEDVINGVKSSSALTSIDEVKEGSKYKINGETYYVAVMKELKGLPFKAIPFVGLVKESDGSLAAKSGDEIEREIKNGDWEHVTEGKIPSAEQDAKQSTSKQDSGTPNIIKLKDFNNVSADRLKRIQGFLQTRNPDNPNEQRILEDDGMDDDRLADLQAVAERNMSNRGLNDKTREYCKKWNDLALAEIRRRNKERKGVKQDSGRTTIHMSPGQEDNAVAAAAEDNKRAFASAPKELKARDNEMVSSLNKIGEEMNKKHPRSFDRISTGDLISRAIPKENEFEFKIHTRYYVNQHADDFVEKMLPEVKKLAKKNGFKYIELGKSQGATGDEKYVKIGFRKELSDSDKKFHAFKKI